MQQSVSSRARYLKIAGMVLIPLAVLMPLGAVTTGWLSPPTFIPDSARDERARLFVKQMIELKQRTSAKEAAFLQRFARLPMDAVLDADHLVTPEGRASGRATLNQLRAMVAERAALRNDASAELREIIATVPDARDRNYALASANANHAQSVKWADEMDQSQLQLADAYEAIIDWCEGQGKSLTAVNNQLGAMTPRQRTQLDSLLDTVSKVEQRENEHVTRAENNQQKSEREFDRVTKRVGQ